MAGPLSFALTAGPPGALGPSGEGLPRGLAVLLFDAGAAVRAHDPVRLFLRDDAPALDWRADFLRSDFIDRLFEDLEPEAFGEDEEVVYEKSALVTTGQVALDADAG